MIRVEESPPVACLEKQLRLVRVLAMHFDVRVDLGVGGNELEAIRDVVFA